MAWSAGGAHQLNVHSFLSAVLFKCPDASEKQTNDKPARPLTELANQLAQRQRERKKDKLMGLQHHYHTVDGSICFSVYSKGTARKWVRFRTSRAARTKGSFSLCRQVVPGTRKDLMFYALIAALLRPPPPAEEAETRAQLDARLVAPNCSIAHDEAESLWWARDQVVGGPGLSHAWQIASRPRWAEHGTALSRSTRGGLWGLWVGTPERFTDWLCVCLV
jgi:hypothetical protein